MRHVAEAARRPGRPRDPNADAAIIEAALEVLTEHGFGGFTVEAVAARAGVGKATIYRRWPSREDLLFGAASQVVAPPVDPDSGSLREDLVTMLSTAYRSKAAASEDNNLLSAIVAESAVNPELKRFLKQFLDQRRSTIRAITQRAVDRGELPAGVDRELLFDLLGGPLFYRVSISDRPVTPAVIAAVVDTVLAGVRATAEG